MLFDKKKIIYALRCYRCYYMKTENEIQIQLTLKILKDLFTSFGFSL